MQIQSLQPPPELAAYVNNILVIVQDTPRPDFILPLYANGASTLVFQSVQGQRSSASIGHLSIYGQAIAPSNLQLKDAFVLIAYFLRPYVMQAITGISALELTDTVADMAALKTAREAVPAGTVAGSPFAGSATGADQYFPVEAGSHRPHRLQPYCLCHRRFTAG